MEVASLRACKAYSDNSHLFLSTAVAAQIQQHAPCPIPVVVFRLNIRIQSSHYEILSFHLPQHDQIDECAADDDRSLIP